MHTDVRVRFAPSPTGLLHIGGLRTALYNYLFAKHHKGSFVLRIEDTDRARYVEEAEKDILESLAWAGLHPDEGPAIMSQAPRVSDAEATGGEPKKVSRVEYESGDNNATHSPTGSYGPYHQSERKERYLDYAKQLLDQGHAYYAFDTVDEIEDMRKRLQTPDNPTPKYDPVTRSGMRNSLTLPEEEVRQLLEQGVEYVIRLKVPADETVRFEDMIRGSVAFDTSGLDDQVLVKADGMPTYHLANVVDDHEMAITHVIRGEEWLSSAPKHILLYQYLDWQPPVMAHLPLIMSPSGGKLSKRKAEKEGIPVNVKDYRQLHYERDAVINFLALLGWSPGEDRETMTLEQMEEEFSLDRVGKSGAIFDYDKLTWFNEHYMRQRPDEELARELSVMILEEGFMPQLTNSQKAMVHDLQFMSGMVGLLKERVSRLPEILEAGSFFFNRPETYDAKAVKKGWKENTPEMVKTYHDRIWDLESDAFKADKLKQILTEVIEEQGVGFGKLMMPLRIAVTGTGSGPDLFGTMELLGREEITARLKTAIENIA